MTDDTPKNPATIGERLAALQPSTFTTVRKIEQGGALQARRLSGGTIQFYWRYTHDGKTDRVAIGVYDPSAPPKSLKPTSRGYSLVAAAEACREKALLQHQHKPTGGYREHEASLKRAHAEAKDCERKASEQTLEKLLDAYCDHLEAKGRRSHADARSIFQLHIKDAWPKLAAAPAATITPTQVTDALRKLVEEKKGRTSNKLRSYLRAAYQCAVDANALASIPGRFKDFRVTTNPVALTKRDASYDRADKRPLELLELQAYWRLLQPVTGVAGIALRLHLLTGGQRVEQLVRLKHADIRDGYITLFDAKGRPGKGARTHVLPLTPRAQAELAALTKSGEFALSTDGGETHLSAATMSNWAKEVTESIPGFQLKRVRSGVETNLARAGVSLDVRAQLQSHGITGVQARHYDDYDYEKEKLAALMVLDGLLCGARSKAGKAPAKSKSKLAE